MEPAFQSALSLAAMLPYTAYCQTVKNNQVLCTNYNFPINYTWCDRPALAIVLHQPHGRFHLGFSFAQLDRYKSVELEMSRSSIRPIEPGMRNRCKSILIGRLKNKPEIAQVKWVRLEIFIAINLLTRKCRFFVARRFCFLHFSHIHIDEISLVTPIVRVYLFVD